jgi:DNA-binding NarL/FixJ family response regulator
MTDDTRTVWIIEDNRFYGSMVEDLVNHSKKFQCPQRFRSCEDALKVLSAETPPDVILLDIGLPGMSGIEGIGRIKSISPTTEIIIQTIHDDDDNVFKALAAGASGYLLKATVAEKIIESIDEVIHGGAPINAQIAKKVLARFSKPDPPHPDYQLTTREREVLGFLVQGNTKSRIAEQLFLSPHTVDHHIRNIYSKLHVHSRMAVVSKALKEGLS